MVLIVECEKGTILSVSAEKLALSGRVDVRHEAEQVLSHLTLHSVSTGTVTEGVLGVTSLAGVEGVTAGQSHADFVQWDLPKYVKNLHLGSGESCQDPFNLDMRVEKCIVIVMLISFSST